MQGVARVLSGDLDGGDAYLEDAIGSGDAGAPDALAHALCQRSLVAMTRGQWTRAEALATQARTVLQRAWIEDSDATALVSAVQARLAQHCGDVAVARRELVRARRLRPFLTYAEPTIAVQARIELTRVHLALGDTAGGQDTDAGNRGAAQAAAPSRRPGRRGSGAAGPVGQSGVAPTPSGRRP